MTIKSLLLGIFLGLMLGGCVAINTSEQEEGQPLEPLPYTERQRMLTAEEIDAITELTDNAFMEVRSEGVDIKEQVYSVLNRTRRWTKRSIIETIRQRNAYSWRHEFPKGSLEKFKEEEYNKWLEIFMVAERVFLEYGDGTLLEDEMKLTRNHDHYLTKKLADSGNAPNWFYNYCKDKRTVGKQVYCIGVPKHY